MRLDITALTKPGREQHLHVVCGSFDTAVLPSGETKITGLSGSWFGRIARGIWQDVFLEAYPPVSLEDLTIRTSVRQGRLEVDALISSTEEGPSPEGMRVLFAGQGAEVRRPVSTGRAAASVAAAART
ncbi:hypothetical protein ACFSQ7_07480 [Paenibacillus rhizoplanae]